MEPYVKISLLLCTFGLLKGFRPIDVYSFEYFTGPDHNFTEEETLKLIYPISQYMILLNSVFAFFITDLSRYKPMIVVLAASAVIAWSIYVTCESLTAILISNFFYGVYTASEVAYYSYIYAKVDVEHYQKVTSYTRAAILIGRCLCGVVAQIIVSTRTNGSLQELVYVSLASFSFATLWALFLPSVQTSLYFNPKDSTDLTFGAKASKAFSLMKTHFFNACTNPYVIKWSVWWALASGGFFQVETYVQTLYVTIRGPGEARYNGAVEAVVTLLGAFGAFSAGYFKTSWETKGELVLGFFSLVQGILVVVISQTDLIFLCYGFYVLFGILYNFMITVASAEIAKNIDEDSYGLVFGINQFLALVVTALLATAVATEGVGFALEPRGQFTVYGGYHLVLALIFICIGIRTWLVNKDKL